MAEKYHEHSDSLDMANFLLDLKANPNSKASDGITILQYAVENNLVFIIKRLFSDKNKFKLNNEMEYKWYKDPNQKTSKQTGTLLHWAVESKNIEILKLLIAKNNDANTALYLAIEQNNLEVAKLLLETKADPCTQEKYIWEIKENKNKRIGSMVHWAVENNDGGILNLLIKAGVDLNAKDSCNNTPLYYATEKSNSGLIQLLLTAKADMNAHST